MRCLVYCMKEGSTRHDCVLLKVWGCVILKHFKDLRKLNAGIKKNLEHRENQVHAKNVSFKLSGTQMISDLLN